MRLFVCQRLDELIVQFGDKLVTLTADSAVEDIVQLKNAEIANLRGDLNKDTIDAQRKEIETLSKEIRQLKQEIYHTRGFRHLVKTFCIRVMEKLRLRDPVQPDFRETT